MPEQNLTEITLPYNYTPRDYQLPFLQAFDEGAKRLVVVWHRRSGKDKTVLQLFAKEMMNRVGTYYYFFPTYEQGRKILWEGLDKDGFPFMDHFPKELVLSKHDSMRIYFKNGSIFQIVGTDKIDSLIGTNPLGCAFSEYSVQRPQAWDFIRPILAENGGWAVFDFTPRGMNHGWKILQQGKAEGWFTQILTVEDTKAINADALAAEKRQMSEALYQQEYYCKFIEGAGSVFRRIQENLWSGDMQPVFGRSYQVGVDLAKYQDWTVLTVIDLHTWKIAKQERFNQIDWNLQKAKIEAYARRYNNARIKIDATGIGDPIVDDLRAQGVVIGEDDAIKFTELMRRQLLDNLVILLEQDRIKIPNDEGLLDELRSMQFSLTDVGRLKMEVPTGTTDDRIMSLALAVWELRSPYPLPSRDNNDEVRLYGQEYT